MLGTFAVYLGIGKLFTYIGQKFVADATNSVLLNKWASCDLCSGFWIFTALSYFLKVYAFLDITTYIPFLSELITGATASLAMHLISIGWREKFNVLVI